MSAANLMKVIGCYNVTALLLDVLCEMSPDLILCAVPILINSGVSLSLSVHLSLSQSTISIAFSLFIVLARWVDRDMHYSSVCPFCHCRAELSEQRGAKQNYNQSNGLWHLPQWEMLIGCHRMSMQIEKCCGPFCTHSYLSGWFSYQPQLSSLVFCSSADKILKPPVSGKHSLQSTMNTAKTFSVCGAL